MWIKNLGGGGKRKIDKGEKTKKISDAEFTRHGCPCRLSVKLHSRPHKATTNRLARQVSYIQTCS